MHRLSASAIAAILSSGCYQVTEQPNLAGQDVRLTVLHTADIHSRILPYYQVPGLIDRGYGSCAELQPFGGAARLQHLMKREKARADRVVHVDSGDIFEGAPIFNQFQGEAEMKVQSVIKPDAMVIGNHEFDLGTLNVAQKYAQFGAGVFPMLAANYIFNDPSDPRNSQLGALVKPYTIVDADGIRIGVIGMGNYSSMVSLGNKGNSLGITPLEPVEALRQYVQILQPQVDLVFVVSHLGLTSDAQMNDAEDEEMITGYQKLVPKNSVYPGWKVLNDAPNDQVLAQVPGIVGIDAIFGGHLHIVLNPPKELIDPAGRRVLLIHSGSFARYFGRADMLVHMPGPGEDRTYGAEIVSHDYEIIPVTGRIPKTTPGIVEPCPSDGSAQTRTEDATDEVDSTTSCLALAAAQIQIDTCAIADACRQNQDACSKPCIEARRTCTSVPAPVDGRMTEILQPYVQTLYQKQDLGKAFAIATQKITRFGVSGEDSPLGNLVADSMRKRNRIESELSLTNTLGIRVDMEQGPVTIEDMYNIFPFENTLTVMYLSGEEIQELFDFVTDKSAQRGCQTQAQISGVTFTMNCAQSLRNQSAPACKVTADCENTDFAKVGTHQPVRCVDGQCYKSPSENIQIGGVPMIPTESYKTAVNDYIAVGGSGFEVLRRNTTKVFTTLSLRDALIDYMRLPPEDGGAGRVCGSKAMVNPQKPEKPFVVYNKTTQTGVSCDQKPDGCTDATGVFFDCQEDDTSVRFYCIPYDFMPTTNTPGSECDGIAQMVAPFQVVDRDSSIDTTTACAAAPAKSCQGTLHCCEKNIGNGKLEATFYCLVPFCVDPPATSRIQRIVQ
jgi:2',3'-cyclic-nucleotide 2'-phosphodiesterase (5'-nucleotidase family)